MAHSFEAPSFAFINRKVVGSNPSLLNLMRHRHDMYIIAKYPVRNDQKAKAYLGTEEKSIPNFKHILVFDITRNYMEK